MSVFVKGMEMPNRCFECIFLTTAPNFFCLAGKRDLCAEHGINISRPDWCPLVDVKTPHGRLIDADELMKDIAELKKSPWYNAENHAFYKEAVDIIESLCIKKALTVIEAEEEEK